MPRGVVSQAAQYGLPETETVKLSRAEVAELLKPRGLITPGLLNTASTGYDEAEY